jgi:pantoate--beta-alanine ligase
MLRTVPGLRTALRPARRADRAIGLVPTMGALHEGHLSLIRAAREEAHEVVVSLFVNPSQFNDADDLAAYPCDEERDAALAQEAGADILFAPPPEIMYPPGFSTQVRVEGPLTQTLEGAHRGPEHFHGVTTVVTKLLNMVQPDIAFFGQKDAQQALVIRKLVRDLEIDVRIEIGPTVREPDGLALSSRNNYLSHQERATAPLLHRALKDCATRMRAGSRIATALEEGRGALEAAGFAVDYLEARHAETLAPVAALSDGPVRLLVAARIGRTRLIDNMAVG